MPVALGTRNVVRSNNFQAISAGTKSIVEILILVITLLANCLNLNSTNSSKPSSSDPKRTVHWGSQNLLSNPQLSVDLSQARHQGKLCFGSVIQRQAAGICEV